LRVSVPEVNIQRGGLTAISVGQAGIGPIQVGELVLDNAELTMSAGQAMLQDVEVTVALTVTLSWSLHIPLPWPFDDINEGDTYTFDAPPFTRR